MYRGGVGRGGNRNGGRGRERATEDLIFAPIMCYLTRFNVYLYVCVCVCVCMFSNYTVIPYFVI